MENTTKYTLLPDELIPGKPDHDPNITYIKRTIKEVTLEADNQREKTTISEIKRIRLTKIGTKGIKERSEIAKFGQCAQQSRGTVEAGIVRVDNEYRIVDRKKAVFQESLKEKLKTNTSGVTKKDLLERMLNEQEKERMIKEEKISQKTTDNKYKRRKRDAKETDIKITGFDMRLEEQDLIEIFEKVGPVSRCIIIRDKNNRNIKRNIAYLEFRATLHVPEAIEKYNNKTVGNSVFIVCRPNDDE